jgi:hypothetical protein
MTLDVRRLRHVIAPLKEGCFLPNAGCFRFGRGGCTSSIDGPSQSRSHANRRDPQAARVNVNPSREKTAQLEDPKAAHQRALRQFFDPHREWRRLFSEAWGTFLLVLAGAGAGVVGALTGKVSPGMAAVAPGLTVMAVIYFMGTVSGAHLNPAVTIAFAVRRNFPWMRVPGYLVAQFAGGILAAVFLMAVFGKTGKLGATVPGDGISSAQHRDERGHRYRWIYRARRLVGGTDQRRLDEPSAVRCSRSRARRIRDDLDLCRWSVVRRAYRGGIRMDSQGAANARRHAHRPRHVG